MVLAVREQKAPSTSQGMQLLSFLLVITMMNYYGENVDRANMWSVLIPNLSNVGGHERRRLKMAFAAAYGKLPNQIVGYSYEWSNCDMMVVPVFKEEKKMFTNTITGSSCDMICIDDFTSSMPVTYAATPKVPKGCGEACQPIQNKKENNMGYANTAAVRYTDESFNQEKAAREHMEDRLYGAYHTKQDDLRTKFHMRPVEINTIKELKDALANGTIIVYAEHLKDDHSISWGWGDYLTAKDKDRDEAGYKLADGLLDTAFTKAKDTIKVLPVDKGLEALQQFEAATF